MAKRAYLATWIRSALTENLGLKALAIVASLFLFSLIHGAEDAQRTMMIDVVVTLPADVQNKMLLTELPSEVRVLLRGRRSVLTGLERDDVPPIQVDLRDPRRSFFYFSPSTVEVPAGVSVVSIWPPVVELDWADVSEREVGVTPSLIGTLRDGLEIREDVTLSPSSIRVRGPDVEIAGFDRIVTEPIDLNALQVGTTHRDVALAPPPEHVTFVGPPRVELTVVVAEREARRSEPPMLSIDGGTADAASDPNR